MRTLLIDDERNLKADIIARNYKEGIRQLVYNGLWDKLLLDHDLADFDSKGQESTGYDVLLWLEEFVYSNAPLYRKLIVIPVEIELVTSNASAIPKMEKAIYSIYSKLDQLKQESKK